MTSCRTTTEPGQDPAAARAGAILTIDLGAILENYRRLKGAFQGKEIAPVLKANGYGLGAGAIAPVLAGAGARRFFVAHLDEAIELRGVLDAEVPDCSIFVLNGLVRGAEPEFHHHRLRPVLNSLGELEAWTDLARQKGHRLAAGLHIDSGMNRLGLPRAELDRLAGDHALLDGADLDFIMSHLACADTPAHALNSRQLHFFRQALTRLPPAPASFANSSGIFLSPDYHFDLARPGVGLYGVNPTPDAPNPMTQVVRLQGRILQVRDIDAPQSVGYGATHRARGPAQIATVAVGYADGYLRHLSNQASAWIGGQRVPLVGRVSMDLITLDVTGVPFEAARPGKFADLIAPTDGLDRLAEEAGTIAYEILTALGPRYHRVYLT
jgi:alanine racemase